MNCFSIILFEFVSGITPRFISNITSRFISITDVPVYLRHDIPVYLRLHVLILFRYQIPICIPGPVLACLFVVFRSIPFPAWFFTLALAVTLDLPEHEIPSF